MTASDTLGVSGGAGGVTAKYEDMLATAASLDRIGDSLTDRGPLIGALARNGDLLESSVLSPGTAADVLGHVTAATMGPRGLVAGAATMKATSLRLTVAVEAYRTLDDALARAAVAGDAVGAPFALLGMGLAAGDNALGRAGNDLLHGDFADLKNIPGLGGDELLADLYKNPWLVDGLITDAPAAMWLLGGPVTGPLLNLWTTGTEGAPFPPTDVPGAAGDLVALGGIFGIFKTGTPRITESVTSESVPKNMSAPTSLEATMDGISQLGDDNGTIRIFAVPQPDGTQRWVVEIPGTEDWSPKSGSNPVDLTNNVRLMAGQQTEQNEAIRKAMRQAQIQPGEPVMLAGHSQGGITAASLAADPATRGEFDITNVYTGGAPIARFDIPDDVHVLSIEHDQDVVPRLDGRPNPDRPGWVTVHRDATGLAISKDHVVANVGDTHNSHLYRQTAGLIDASTDPTIVQERESFDPFFAGSGETKVSVFDLIRDPQ
jgi:hypothetical protein